MVRTRVSSSSFLSYYPNLWTMLYLSPSSTVSTTTSSTDDQHQWWPNTKFIPQSPSHVSYRIFPKQQGIGLFTRVVTNFYSSALSSSSSSSWSCEWCWQVLRQKWRIPSPLPLFTFLQHNHHHRQHHHEDLHENYIIIIIFPSTITCQLYDDTAICHMPKVL